LNKGNVSVEDLVFIPGSQAGSEMVEEDLSHAKCFAAFYFLHLDVMRKAGIRGTHVISIENIDL